MSLREAASEPPAARASANGTSAGGVRSDSRPAVRQHDGAAPEAIGSAQPAGRAGTHTPLSPSARWLARARQRWGEPGGGELRETTMLEALGVSDWEEAVERWGDFESIGMQLLARWAGRDST